MLLVYALAKELYPGRYRPTLSHTFIKLLSQKSLLHTCFTQNIDTLERRAGVPAGKIVEAHGSFATQRCIDCKRKYDSEKMKHTIHEGVVPRCENCNGLVKPDIVFFGESLPDSFRRSSPQLCEADLLNVMGTSLTVHPFASLVNMVPSKCPRVLINLDHVGNIGNKVDDIVLLGKCDEIIQELCKELGWEEDLMKEWEATAASVEGGAESKDRVSADVANNESEDKVADEVEELAKNVEKALAISEEKDVNDAKQGEVSREESSAQLSNAQGADTNVSEKVDGDHSKVEGTKATDSKL